MDPPQAGAELVDELLGRGRSFDGHGRAGTQHPRRERPPRGALLGFDCGEPGVFSREWIDRIIGLENVTVEVVMARAPDGSDMFEVVRFHSPSAGAQELAPAANRPGLRHVAFKVDDVRGVVDRVRAAGWDTVGEIVDFEHTFLLCYVRGPDGLIVELAERLDGAPD